MNVELNFWRESLEHCLVTYNIFHCCWGTCRSRQL